jgi:uncharacterized repeat protein (TIGR03803 family)
LRRPWDDLQNRYDRHADHAAQLPPNGRCWPEGLVQASDGNLYGTTNAGGFTTSVYGNMSGTCGTVFKMTPTGALTTVHIFNYTDGGNPGGGSDPGCRWKHLRDHGRRRDCWPWISLSNHSNRHVYHGTQLRPENWRWCAPSGTGPAHQRDPVRADRSWRRNVSYHGCPTRVACCSVCRFLEAHWLEFLASRLTE